MIYEKELVWASHPDFNKPVRMTRGMLTKKHRLGWRETGEQNDNKEIEIKKEVKSFNENKRERTDEYNRLISTGVIREHGNNG